MKLAANPHQRPRSFVQTSGNEVSSSFYEGFHKSVSTSKPSNSKPQLTVECSRLPTFHAKILSTRQIPYGHSFSSLALSMQRRFHDDFKQYCPHCNCNTYAVITGGSSAAEPSNSPTHQNDLGLVSVINNHVEKISPLVQLEEIYVGQTEATGEKNSNKRKANTEFRLAFRTKHLVSQPINNGTLHYGATTQFCMKIWDLASRGIDDDLHLVCVSLNGNADGSTLYSSSSEVESHPQEIVLLRSLPQADAKLEYAEVDLLDYGSLSDLFVGCTGVFYVPAPNYDINGSVDYPEEAINNEVGGVLNVVEACANTPSVRKLVLTSCLSSILWDRQYCSSGSVLDERNWSDVDFCRKQKMLAALSKTQAERAAWVLATDRGLALVVMNPAVVAGPKQAFGHTNSLMLDQSGIFAYVHVDDLAAAHVLAFEVEHAAGRYICFEKLLSKADILEAAREMYPNHPIDKR